MQRSAVTERRTALPQPSERQIRELNAATVCTEASSQNHGCAVQYSTMVHMCTLLYPARCSRWRTVHPCTVPCRVSKCTEILRSSSNERLNVSRPQSCFEMPFTPALRNPCELATSNSWRRLSHQRASNLVAMWCTSSHQMSVMSVHVSSKNSQQQTHTVTVQEISHIQHFKTLDDRHVSHEVWFKVIQWGSCETVCCRIDRQ